ncbi:hypothetical protein [Flagellimonas iocasae]|uniref:DUF2975 domain-containing protein n=1 Tax=Flagellimonas iocasae TaxID=2055905 RepID=A0ABW4XY34_9FLAO
MTTKDFFRLIIKALGTYCFVDALFTLVPNMSYSSGFLSFHFAMNLIYLIVTGLITYILLFQTDRIIKLFRLTKGFDSDIIETKDLKTKGLFKFAVILIGLLLIVNNLAQFIDYCYLAFKNQVSAYGLGEVEGAMFDQHLDYNWWAISGLNILIGILMLMNYDWIAKIFTKEK